jgi:hypothetical protein
MEKSNHNIGIKEQAEKDIFKNFFKAEDMMTRQGWVLSNILELERQGRVVRREVMSGTNPKEIMSWQYTDKSTGKILMEVYIDKMSEVFASFEQDKKLGRHIEEAKSNPDLIQ